MRFHHMGVSKKMNAQKLSVSMSQCLNIISLFGYGMGSHVSPDIVALTKPSYEWLWRFPKMGVTLNHPFDFRIFHCKPSSYWGTPMTKPPYGYGVYRNQPGYQLWDYYTILYHFEYFYTLLLLYTLLYTLLWDSYFYRNQPVYQPVYQPVIILGNLHISSPELLS